MYGGIESLPIISIGAVNTPLKVKLKKRKSMRYIFFNLIVIALVNNQDQ